VTWAFAEAQASVSREKGACFQYFTWRVPIGKILSLFNTNLLSFICSKNRNLSNGSQTFGARVNQTVRES